MFGILLQHYATLILLTFPEKNEKKKKSLMNENNLFNHLRSKPFEM